MTVNIAEQFLAGRINYERALSMPNSEEVFKLDRMRELLRRLGDPQLATPIIHVAGTKGKGSTAAMIAAILTAAGHRTGLFSSPHIDHITERMTIDGLPCSADEFADLVELARPVIEAMDREGAERDPPEPGPTYFEIITAMALKHFSIQNAAAAVLEVGLGGRLDSTNVCLPCLSVITSISFDHTRQLGDTLAKIAAEKAGIIKPGVTVVSGVRSEEPRAVIRRAAAEAGCRLVELGVDFDYEYHPPRNLDRAPSPAVFDFHFSPSYLASSHLASLHLASLHLASSHLAPGEYTGGKTADPAVTQCRRASLSVAPTMDSAINSHGFTSVLLSLLGRHQAANAAIALAAVEELRRDGWTIPDAAIRRGLVEVSWPARVEIIARRPTVVVDAAHNVASIKALVETLDESFAAARRLLIFATTLDKDVEGMLRALLGRFDRVIFTRYSNNPRGVPPEELQRLASIIKPRPVVAPEISPRPLGEGPGVRAASIETAPTPSDAWNMAGRIVRPDDLVCITGSFFLAAEMRRLIAERPLTSAL